MTTLWMALYAVFLVNNLLKEKYPSKIKQVNEV